MLCTNYAMYLSRINSTSGVHLHNISSHIYAMPLGAGLTAPIGCTCEFLALADREVSIFLHQIAICCVIVFS